MSVDTRPPASASRPDVAFSESAPRPTPAPARVPFAAIVSAGAGVVSAVTGGARAAFSAAPFGPASAIGGARALSAEGPQTSGSGSGGGLEATLAESQDMNLYYLRIQEQVNAENRAFTALSNVLHAEHETAKAAIGNIR